MITLTGIFDGLVLSVSEENWAYLCTHRFFSDEPTIEEIRAEFVSGTGITEEKKDRWTNADDDFCQYIEDLKEIFTMEK